MRHGDALTVLRGMPNASVHMCVTSPPYWGLRSYLPDGHADKSLELGLEKLHDCLGWATGAPCGACYICRTVEVFREVRRVLRADGTCWVNIGDSYNSGTSADRTPTHTGKHGYWENPIINKRVNCPQLKPKDLCGIPYRLALALQADGWWLRDVICWYKPAPMPESVRDRCTKSWEPILMLAKAERYFFDAEAIREPFADARQGRDGGTAASERNRGGRLDGYTKPSGIDPSANGGRNRRNVWRLSPMPTPDAHFSTFPLELPELCIKAGCPEGGTVLDPFAGAGTTGLACLKVGREFIGIELNAEYIRIAEERAQRHMPLLAEVTR